MGIAIVIKNLHNRTYSCRFFKLWNYTEFGESNLWDCGIVKPPVSPENIPTNTVFFITFNGVNSFICRHTLNVQLLSHLPSHLLNVSSLVRKYKSLSQKQVSSGKSHTYQFISIELKQPHHSNHHSARYSLLHCRSEFRVILNVQQTLFIQRE